MDTGQDEAYLSTQCHPCAVSWRSCGQQCIEQTGYPETYELQNEEFQINGPLNKRWYTKNKIRITHLFGASSGETGSIESRRSGAGDFLGVFTRAGGLGARRTRAGGLGARPAGGGVDSHAGANSSVGSALRAALPIVGGASSFDAASAGGFVPPNRSLFSAFAVDTWLLEGACGIGTSHGVANSSVGRALRTPLPRIGCVGADGFGARGFEADGVEAVGFGGNSVRDFVLPNHSLFNACTADTRPLGLAIIKLLTNPIPSLLTPFFFKISVGNGFKSRQ